MKQNNKINLDLEQTFYFNSLFIFGLLLYTLLGFLRITKTKVLYFSSQTITNILVYSSKYLFLKPFLTEFNVIIFTIILSIINFYLLGYVLKKIDILDFNKNLFYLLYIISPITIFTFFNFTILPILLLCSLLLLITKSKNYVLLYYSLFILISIISPIYAIILFILFYLGKDKFKLDLTNKSYYILIVPLIILLIYIYFNKFEFMSINLNKLLNTSFIEFGGFNAYSLFYITIACLGLFLNITKQKLSLITLFIFSIILSLYVDNLRLLVNIITVGLTVEFIYYLFNKSWDINYIKTMTLFVLFCIFLFTTLFYIKLVYTSEPTFNSLNSYKVLNNEPGGMVLSDISVYPYILYYTSNSVYFNSDPIQLQKLLQFYETVNLKDSIKFLMDNNITYIYLNKDFEKAHWTVSDTGLLHVIRLYKKTFFEIYNSDGIKIYKIIYDSPEIKH